MPISHKLSVRVTVEDIAQQLLKSILENKQEENAHLMDAAMDIMPKWKSCKSVHDLIR